MNTKDITKEQMETLVLIRSLEEFIADKPDEFDSLAEAISRLDEGLSMEDGKQLIADIKSLTEKGYLISNAGENNENNYTSYEMPTVEGITPKGKSALDEWEQELKESVSKGKEEKVVIMNHYSLFGGITINNSLFNVTDSVFSVLGKIFGSIFSKIISKGTLQHEE